MSLAPLFISLSCLVAQIKADKGWATTSACQGGPHCPRPNGQWLQRRQAGDSHSLGLSSLRKTPPPIQPSSLTYLASESFLGLC